MDENKAGAPRPVPVHNIIQLDVGGRRFKTTLATLQCSPTFWSRIDQHSCIQSDGSYFLDRDGGAFNHLLEFCRTGKYKSTGALEQELIKREALFFGLEALTKEIEESQKIVKLNVGGHKFETTIGTLTSNGDCVLAKMFSGDLSPAILDQDGFYFIDRNGALFGHILEFLRSQTLPSKNSLAIHELEALKGEAHYFGIPEIVACCNTGILEFDVGYSSTITRNDVQNIQGIVNSALRGFERIINKMETKTLDVLDTMERKTLKVLALKHNNAAETVRPWSNRR